ncbi:MAG: MYG1 family protein [Patescibacteria group bacterium]
MKKVVTHSGNFHTDELLAVAILRLTFPEPFEIIRSREVEVIQSGDFAIDVGGIYDPPHGRFDHHQEGGAGKRKNGILYSSFSLVWKEFGGKAIKALAKKHSVEISEDQTQDIWNSIDEHLGAPIDAHDVGMETVSPVFDGVYPYLAHNVFSAFHPTWIEEKTYDEAFIEALQVAIKTLSGEIVHRLAEKKAEEEVLSVYEKAEDKRLIILEKKFPWKGILSRFPEPLFVVEPDLTPSLWKVGAVRDDRHSFKNRKSFPLTWAGKNGEEFKNLTGVFGAVFCHNARFVAIAKSKEGAIALARLAVDSSN